MLFALLVGGHLRTLAQPSIAPSESRRRGNGVSILDPGSGHEEAPCGRRAVRCNGAVVELGRRTRNLPPPPNIVWQSLTEPQRRGARPWLNLLADEVEPRVLESVRPKLVIWSSIWPQTPDQLVRFDIAPDGYSGTALTWTLTSPTDLEDPAVGHRRYRLNKLIWADLRYSYGQ
jgi:hypothetical protein